MEILLIYESDCSVSYQVFPPGIAACQPGLLTGGHREVESTIYQALEGLDCRAIKKDVANSLFYAGAPVASSATLDLEPMKIIIAVENAAAQIDPAIMVNGQPPKK